MEHLAELVPNAGESVWFIVEDDSLPFYPVYEARASVLSALIGECYGFESYVIGQKFDWLICENHHDRIFAVGEAVEKATREFALERGLKVFSRGDRR
ncbi:MAG TPA: DUF6756 family protein [Verrucomicrobiae bacterium]